MDVQRLQDISRSLRILRRDLDTLVAPELTTATAQSTLSMVGKVLEMLAAELEAGKRAAPPTANDAAASVQVALAASEQAADRLLSRKIAGVTATAPDDGEGRVAALQLLETAAASAAVSLDPAVWRDYDALAVSRMLRDAGTADTRWEASYLESGAGSRSDGSQDDAGHRIGREFSAEELAVYLNQTGRTRGTASVRRLERLPGGYSKGTYLVELDVELKDSAMQRESWVLRRDLSFTPLQTHVVDEFPLLSVLHQRGLPVPEPLWCEPDAAHLGAPLIAVRRVSGSGDMAQWSQDAASARAIALSAARTLAAIHAIDAAILPPLQTKAPGSSGDTPAALVDHLEAFWRQYYIEPDPLVALMLQWLRQHAPAVGLRGLVHGDYGLHNLLVADGRINAVLDWEFAHIGDPREDLAYARPFVEKVLPWREFADEYEAAGGASSDDAALRFYTVLGTLRNALGCMKVLHALRHDVAGIDAKFIYAGRSYAQQLLRSAAQLTGQL